MSTSDPARERAHLRSLPRCDCGKPATDALYNGVNALYGYYCPAHARKALADFKAGRLG